jgi:hypothetical protein
MVRKVGFDQKDTEAKKSIAESYLDEFRKKHNHALSANPYKPVARKRNWFFILFTAFWLICWTAGILVALGFALSGTAESGSQTFLFIWLVFAVIGWFAVTKGLIRQIKGTAQQNDSGRNG